jgi:DNA-binding beta-propeller fold protein YncE
MDEPQADSKANATDTGSKVSSQRNLNPEEANVTSTEMEDLVKALTKAVTTVDLLGQTREKAQEKAAPTPTGETHILLEFGQETAFQLMNPFSVVVDDSGDILVLDQPERGKHRISRFGSGGQFKAVVTCADKGTGPGQFLYPKGIVLDTSGNIYVPEAGNNRVQWLSKEGKFMGSVGELGERPGQFDFPCDVEVGSDGSLYVADTGNCRVQQVTSRGIPLTLFGVNEKGVSDDTEPELDEPLGVALDAQGFLYVADTNHHRVVKYDQQGKKALVWGCQGEQPGQFQGPSDVHVLSSGIIYVADCGNSRVQMFDSSGTFLEQFRLDGAEKHLSDGGDVAVDEDGCVYICDRVKNVVLKVELLRTSSGEGRAER